MRYVYDLITGEHVGWLEDDQPLPDGLGETDGAPPSPTTESIGVWTGPTGGWVAMPRSLPVQPRIDAAWRAADVFAEAGMDKNARHSIDMYLADPACPPARRDLIIAYSRWWSALWLHYATVKATILAGGDARFDPAVPGPCPLTIWQIAAAT